MASSICFIGGGQMARALAGGLLGGGTPADRITIVDPSIESLKWWSNHRPEVRAVDSADGLPTQQVVILAVKPNVVQAAVGGMKLDQSLVISIAAGVTLLKLGQWIRHGRVVRVMPNTPSLVGAGAAGYAAAGDVTPDDCGTVEAIFSAVGLIVPVAEDLINSVTALSGSGPAYVCMMIEAMADGGVAAGLPRTLAMQLAAQTVFGTAKMVLEDGRHPGQLKDAVASPGGTTIAAIASLERSGIRSSFIDAVLAAKDRADAM